jgi:hypothetical protein
LADVDRRQVAAIVAHPEDIATAALQALIGAAGTNGSRVVPYGDPAAVGARPLIELITNIHVEFVSISDSGTRAIASVIAMPARSVPVRVLAAIGPGLLRMPPRYSIPAIRLFTYDKPPKRPKAFFEQIGRSQTAVGRKLLAAGLAAPSTLIDVSKIARATQLLLSNYNHREAAAAACLPSSERLRELIRLFVGEPGDRDDSVRAPMEIAARLAAHATRLTAETGQVPPE